MRFVQFLAIVLTALALVPAGAHVFSLPNKIGMTQEEYFTVQDIYRGWSLFGIVLFGALLADLALAIVHRHAPRAAWLAVLGFLCIAATLAIFFVWTYPANLATGNWTFVPAGWEALRLRWEYSHAANAVLTFIGFCAVVLSVLRART